MAEYLVHCAGYDSKILLDVGEWSRPWFYSKRVMHWVKFSDTTKLWLYQCPACFNVL